MTRTKNQNRTYLGKPMVCWELLATTSKTGKRVAVQIDEAAGTAEIRAINGDGRTPKFQELDCRTVPAANAEWVAEHMFLAHFTI